MTATMTLNLIFLLLGIFHLSTAFQAPPYFLRNHGRQTTSSSFILHSYSTGQDDPVLRLPLMEAELATISDRDNTLDNDQRIELEEAIQDARTAAEFGVRRVQVDFYDAFSNGDLKAMEAIWSHENFVRCVHPGMSSFEGRVDVMQSWEQILSAPGFIITPTRSRVEICGQTAICSCIEETANGGRLEGLNVYQREGGNWRMTLHMASPIIM